MVSDVSNCVIDYLQNNGFIIKSCRSNVFKHLIEVFEKDADEYFCHIGFYGEFLHVSGSVALHAGYFGERIEFTEFNMFEKMDKDINICLKKHRTQG